jgi:hypothetical protein
MKRFLLMLTNIVVGAMFLASVSYAQQKPGPPGSRPPMQRAQGAMANPRVELRLAMRALWTDHVVYHHNYLVSTLADLPDADAEAQRLLKNQDDIGNAIKPFYGEDAGKKLADLLRGHILIGAEVIKNAKAGDKAAEDKSMADWTANADELATFLSGANPNWPKPVLTQMLHMHLDLLNDECKARLAKDWAGDIKAFDDALAQIYKLADALTFGIERQFPDKFQRPNP